MHPDYAPVEEQTDAALTQLGFAREDSEEFSVRYRRDDGWRVTLAGDPRARPAFDIAIRAPLQDPTSPGYSLRLILRVFHEWAGSPAPVPSLANQIAFLQEREHYIFNVMLPYAAAYRRLVSSPA